jgi:CheY-like chemotaxis protein
MSDVLVVDDDDDIRQAMIEVLEEHGLRAIGAANGSEALAMLRAGNALPCLILLDLMMPLMDGAAFRSAQLKEPALAAIPVVIVSAFADAEETARRLGAAAHLTKPIRLETLIAVVKTYC